MTIFMSLVMEVEDSNYGVFYFFISELCEEMLKFTETVLNLYENRVEFTKARKEKPMSETKAPQPMREKVFDLLIIYWDGCEKIVVGVTNYGYRENGEVFYYFKNGGSSYIPKDQVRFIGKAEDYNEKK